MKRANASRERRERSFSFFLASFSPSLTFTLFDFSFLASSRRLFHRSLRSKFSANKASHVCAWRGWSGQCSGTRERPHWERKTWPKERKKRGFGKRRRASERATTAAPIPPTAVQRSSRLFGASLSSLRRRILSFESTGAKIKRDSSFCTRSSTTDFLLPPRAPFFLCLKNFSDEKTKKQATLAAPVLAGKPLQRRSAARRGRTLAPSAVSRGQGRPTSPLARVVAAEEKVGTAEIDASAPISSSSSAAAAAPERLVPEVADLEDILAERDACGVSLFFEVFCALELDLAVSS